MSFFFLAAKLFAPGPIPERRAQLLGSGQRETYTTSIMTARNFYDKIRYRRKKSGFKRDESGKGKKDVHNGLERNAVVMGVGLSQYG